MSKLELSFSLYAADNAAFQAKCQAIDTAILAMGLVAHAQTGEANLLSITRPTALNQIAGWKVYRFNDALQATKPVFIKIFFGTPASVVTALTTGNNWGIFQLFFQVGTILDGNGNFTPSSKTTAIRALTYNSDSNAQSNTVASLDACNLHLISGSPSRLCLVIGANAAHNPAMDCWQGGANGDVASYLIQSQSSFLLVERSKDSNGGDTDDAIIVMSFGNQFGNIAYNVKWAYSRYIPYLRGNAYEQHLINCFYGGDSTRNTTLNNLDLGVSHLYPMEGTLLKNPPVSLVGHLVNDYIWNGETSSIEIYGAERHFRPIPAKMPIVVGRQFSNSRLAILWED